jgi:GNAT superfamily N-acetyltransferase
MRFIDLDPGDSRLANDVLPVLLELRPHLTPEVFLEIYAEGYSQGLRYTAAYDDHDRCVGAAGWRIIATTVAIRKLYVDDLITLADRRGTGIGTALLTELADRARRLGCTVIDLDSGIARAEAHRFYFRQRMSITSFHFARPLTGVQ